MTEEGKEMVEQQSQEVALAGAKGMFAPERVFRAMVKNFIANRALIDKVIAERLKPGVDFYVIGKNKSLSKPGAESLVSSRGGLFPTEPQFMMLAEEKDDTTGHVTFTMKVELWSGGEKLGEGMGTATSRESKFKYNWLWPSQLKELGIDKEGLRSRTIKDKGVQYRIERDVDQLNDQRNPVLKMCKKRCYVDAALNVTGASRYFTQDLEDHPDFAHAIQEPPKTVDATVESVTTNAPEGREPESWGDAEWVARDEAIQAGGDVEGIPTSKKPAKWGPFKGKITVMRDRIRWPEPEPNLPPADLPEDIDAPTAAEVINAEKEEPEGPPPPPEDDDIPFESGAGPTPGQRQTCVEADARKAGIANLPKWLKDNNFGTLASVCKSENKFKLVCTALRGAAK